MRSAVPEIGTVLFAPGTAFPYILREKEGRRDAMGCGNRGGGTRLLGLFAIALGSGILIAVVFPVGALMFLVAFLLIGCGCACYRH